MQKYWVVLCFEIEFLFLLTHEKLWSGPKVANYSLQITLA